MTKLKVCVAIAAVMTFARFTAAGAAAVNSPRDAEAAPTFTRDIAPIIFNNCTSCHRESEGAPFSLTTYDEVRRKAKLIAKVTERRIMPPWKAEPSHFVKFVGERRLTDEQIALLGRWYESGMAEGDVAALPPMPQFPSGWKLGKPDLVVLMNDAYEVRADGPDIYRYFVLPVPVTEMKYVKAVEFRPGTPVVHHSLFYADSSGKARELDAEDAQPGFGGRRGPGFMPSGGFGGWAVGAQAVPLPDGVAKKLEPGTDLVLQTHFHPLGKVEQEKSAVAFYFSDEPPTRDMIAIPLRSRKIDIDPGVKDYTVTSEFTMPVTADLIGVIPHAHYICTSVEVVATFPGAGAGADGKTKRLLHIKDWDFSWQEQYRYADPIVLPQGTKITATYTFDNSAENPRNPSNPPKQVTWGLQSTDEMALTSLQVIPRRKLDIIPLGLSMLRQGSGDGGEVLGGGTVGAKDFMDLLQKRFDADGDGELSPAERLAVFKFVQDARKREADE